MNTDPNRRWLRFSLRTLFVALTVFGFALGWLAWQSQIVRHRQAMLRQLKADGAAIFIGPVDWMHSPLVTQIRPGDYDYQISSLRKWLGDQRVDLIGFNRPLTAVDRQAIEAIPEAQIHGIP